MHMGTRDKNEFQNMKSKRSWETVLNIVIQGDQAQPGTLVDVCPISRYNIKTLISEACDFFFFFFSFFFSIGDEGIGPFP